MKRIANFFRVALLFAPTAVVLALCLTIPPAPGPPTPPPTTNSSSGLSYTFPIEVLGLPGHSESFSVNVPSGASATSMYLMIHGLGYEGKAGVALNGGAWVSLTDSNVTYPPKESALFGMGGSMSTLRMTIPTSTWTPVNGSNTFQFRFNDADGKTIGFRVLDLNLRNGSTDLINTNTFVRDDPALWTGFTALDADRNAGSNTWFSAVIKERGTNIIAKCTDCHERAGRDLKYFNYSNKAIVERSIFHGLSQSDSEKVATYIRYLSVPYEADARPWNPPYQPAPGMDAKPIRSWAAGGGLQWILEDDISTLDYLFPGGPTTNSVNLTNIINAREIPLAVQLPDWNRWLPKVHPLDQYPTWYATNKFTRIYPDTFLPALLSKTDDEFARYFAGQETVWDNAGNTTPDIKPPKDTPEYTTWANNVRDRRHWRVVKTWELMRNVEDKGLDTSIFAPVANGASLNQRRWFHGSVFRLGPHVIGLDKYDAFQQESMVWYQLQLVLNDGNRRNGSIVPIDWGYQHALAQSSWNNPEDMTFYAITVLNILKGIEVGFNGFPLTQNHSFNPLKADTYRLASQYMIDLYNTIPVGTRRAVAEATILPWLKQAEGFTKAQYIAANRRDDLVDRLAYHLVWFPTIGVDSAIIARIQALHDSLL